MRGVDEALVTGVGVHGGHEATLDAEGIVECLGHGGEAVGGAGCVGDDVVLGRIVVGVVHTHDEGGVFVLCRCGNNDLLGASINVGLSGVSIGEEAGGLHNDVYIQVTPGEVLGVTLSKYLDAVAVDGNRILVVGNILFQVTQNGVMLEQVSQGLVVGQVVDCHDLNVGTTFRQCAEEVTANAAEAVDTYANRHCDVS